MSRAGLFSRLALWVALFCGTAALAAAETAITTLWPWKIKQHADGFYVTDGFSPSIWLKGLFPDAADPRS